MIVVMMMMEHFQVFTARLYCIAALSHLILTQATGARLCYRPEVQQVLCAGVSEPVTDS